MAHSRSDVCVVCLLVQLAPAVHDTQDDASDCGRDHERGVDDRTAVERIGESGMWEYLTRSSQTTPYDRLDENGKLAFRRYATWLFAIMIVVLFSDLATVVYIIARGANGWLLTSWTLANFCALRIGPPIINKRLARLASGNPAAFDAADPPPAN